MSTLVVKFGGSVLTSEAALHRAVSEIYRCVRDGGKVIAVVSAFKGQTDQLLRLAGAQLSRHAVAGPDQAGEDQKAVGAPEG